MKIVVIRLLLILVQLVKTVESRGVLTVKLLQFDNPEGRTFNGGCCDQTKAKRKGLCIGKCDYVMRLTVSGLSRGNDHVFLFHKPIRNDTNSIIFGDEHNGTTLTILFDEWPGYVTMNVFFFDYNVYDDTTVLVDWFDTELYKADENSIYERLAIKGEREEKKTKLLFEWSTYCYGWAHCPKKTKPPRKRLYTTPHTKDYPMTWNNSNHIDGVPEFDKDVDITDVAAAQLPFIDEVDLLDRSPFIAKNPYRKYRPEIRNTANEPPEHHRSTTALTAANKGVIFNKVDSDKRGVAATLPSTQETSTSYAKLASSSGAALQRTRDAHLPVLVTTERNPYLGFNSGSTQNLETPNTESRESKTLGAREKVMSPYKIDKNESVDVLEANIIKTEHVDGKDNNDNVSNVGSVVTPQREMKAPTKFTLSSHSGFHKQHRDNPSESPLDNHMGIGTKGSRRNTNDMNNNGLIYSPDKYFNSIHLSSTTRIVDNNIGSLKLYTQKANTESSKGNQPSVSQGRDDNLEYQKQATKDDIVIPNAWAEEFQEAMSRSNRKTQTIFATSHQQKHGKLNGKHTQSRAWNAPNWSKDRVNVPLKKSPFYHKLQFSERNSNGLVSNENTPANGSKKKSLVPSFNRSSITNDLVTLIHSNKFSNEQTHVTSSLFLPSSAQETHSSMKIGHPSPDMNFSYNQDTGTTTVDKQLDNNRYPLTTSSKDIRSRIYMNPHKNYTDSDSQSVTDILINKPKRTKFPHYNGRDKHQGMQTAVEDNKDIGLSAYTPPHSLQLPTETAQSVITVPKQRKNDSKYIEHERVRLSNILAKVQPRNKYTTRKLRMQKQQNHDTRLETTRQVIKPYKINYTQNKKVQFNKMLSHQVPTDSRYIENNRHLINKERVNTTFNTGLSDATTRGMEAGRKSKPLENKVVTVQTKYSPKATRNNTRLGILDYEGHGEDKHDLTRLRTPFLSNIQTMSTTGMKWTNPKTKHNPLHSHLSGKNTLSRPPVRSPLHNSKLQTKPAHSPRKTSYGGRKSPTENVMKPTQKTTKDIVALSDSRVASILRAIFFPRRQSSAAAAFDINSHKNKFTNKQLKLATNHDVQTNQTRRPTKSSPTHTFDSFSSRRTTQQHTKRLPPTISSVQTTKHKQLPASTISPSQITKQYKQRPALSESSNRTVEQHRQRPTLSKSHPQNTREYKQRPVSLKTYQITQLLKIRNSSPGSSSQTVTQHKQRPVSLQKSSQAVDQYRHTPRTSSRRVLKTSSTTPTAIIRNPTRTAEEHKLERTDKTERKMTTLTHEKVGGSIPHDKPSNMNHQTTPTGKFPVYPVSQQQFKIEASGDNMPSPDTNVQISNGESTEGVSGQTRNHRQGKSKYIPKVIVLRDRNRKTQIKTKPHFSQDSNAQKSTTDAFTSTTKKHSFHGKNKQPQITASVELFRNTESRLHVSGTSYDTTSPTPLPTRRATLAIEHLLSLLMGRTDTITLTTPSTQPIKNSTLKHNQINKAKHNNELKESTPILVNQTSLRSSGEPVGTSLQLQKAKKTVPVSGVTPRLKTEIPTGIVKGEIHDEEEKSRPSQMTSTSPLITSFSTATNGSSQHKRSTVESSTTNWQTPTTSVSKVVLNSTLFKASTTSPKLIKNMARNETLEHKKNAPSVKPDRFAIGLITSTPKNVSKLKKSTVSTVTDNKANKMKEATTRGVHHFNIVTVPEVKLFVPSTRYRVSTESIDTFKNRKSVLKVSGIEDAVFSENNIGEVMKDITMADEYELNEYEEWPSSSGYKSSDFHLEKLLHKYWPAILGSTVGAVFLSAAILTSITCRRRILIRRMSPGDSPEHLQEPPDTADFSSCSGRSSSSASVVTVESGMNSSNAGPQ